MIAQFRYSEAPCGHDVIVRMEWSDGRALARVEAPEGVSHRLEDLDIKEVCGTVGLEFALAYGVMIAALANAKLTLSGDVSVWPIEWGALYSRRSSQLVSPKDRAH